MRRLNTDELQNWQPGRDAWTLESRARPGRCRCCGHQLVWRSQGQSAAGQIEAARGACAGRGCRGHDRALAVRRQDQSFQPTRRQSGWLYPGGVIPCCL